MLEVLVVYLHCTGIAHEVMFGYSHELVNCKELEEMSEVVKGGETVEDRAFHQGV